MGVLEETGFLGLVLEHTELLVVAGLYKSFGALDLRATDFGLEEFGSSWTCSRKLCRALEEVSFLEDVGVLWLNPR